MMKVLINVPSLEKPGGVSNHYKGLLPFWTEEIIYNSIGGRFGMPGPLILIFDYIKYLFLCAIGRYDAILLNPSLGKTAILRDSVFLWIATRMKIKTVVFFHGWDSELAGKICNDPRRFVKMFKSATAFIVLAREFETTLRRWGCKQPVYLVTTKVDDRLLDGFLQENKIYDDTLLFLARIEINKGVLTAIECFEILKKNRPNARLLIAGTGSALVKAMDYVKRKCIPDVTFLGHLQGNDLIKAFQSSSIYLLPTTHGEGMPTSVLEAMAFALPIVTRPVGGVVDFFEHGEMGFLIESMEPVEYASIIDLILSDPARIKQIGAYNHHYAMEHFLASKVASRIEKILGEIA